MAGYITRKLPREADGTFDVENARKWMAANLNGSKELRESSGEKKLDRLKEETGKIREERLTKRLKRLMLRKRLIEKDKYDQRVAELCIRIKTRLEAIPDEMEMEFPVETRVDNKRSLENKIQNILREMSQWEL